MGLGLRGCTGDAGDGVGVLLLEPRVLKAVILVKDDSRVVDVVGSGGVNVDIGAIVSFDLSNVDPRSLRQGVKADFSGVAELMMLKGRDP